MVSFHRWGSTVSWLQSHYEETVSFLPLISKDSWYSIDRPRKDKRLSWHWSNPVVLNPRPLEWESSWNNPPFHQPHHFYGQNLNPPFWDCFENSNHPFIDGGRAGVPTINCSCQFLRRYRPWILKFSKHFCSRASLLRNNSQWILSFPHFHLYAFH